MVLAVVVAAAAALLLEVSVCRLMIRRNSPALLDEPGERSLHETPKPRGAGVGFVFALWLAYGVSAVLGPSDEGVGVLPGVLGLASAVGLVGFVDDYRSLSAGFRLAVHLGIAASTVALFSHLPFRLSLHDLTWVAPIWLATTVSVIWVAGLINTFNFMDGTDGMVAVQSGIAAGAWAIVGWFHGATSLTVVMLGLLGALAGFLTLNWPPSRIFMGDVGSTTLGFIFAAIPFIAPDEVNRGLVALAVVWPFVFDTFFTFVSRAIRRERVWEAHRTHLFQRLVTSGYSHAAVAVLYGSLTLATATLALAAERRLVPTPGVLAGLGGVAIALLALTRWREGQAQPVSSS